MTRACAAGLLLLCMWACFPTAAGAADTDRINAFYRDLVEAMKRPSDGIREAVSLVRKDPGIARACLEAVEGKCSGTGQQSDAFRLVRDELKAVIALVEKRIDCAGSQAAEVVRIAKNRPDAGETALLLEMLTDICPGCEPALTALADSYLRQRQFGMAARAYEKALAIKENEDSRQLLKEARRLEKEYSRGTPITMARVRELFKERTMAPIPRRIGRKIEVASAIQRQILFDEWSYTIKPKFIPEVQAVGRVVSDELRRNDDLGLLIEGHTDRRGPLDKNMELSFNRAGALKDYLVKHFDIDPDRIVVKGYGPHRPFSPRDDHVGWAMNRRVELKKLESITDLK